MKRLLFVFALAAILIPALGTPAHAAGFTVSGWIPYWAVSDGIKDANKHLDALTELHPFSYSVSADGTPRDLADSGSTAWQRLFRSARADGVKIVPTLMWSDTANIQKILSSTRSRAAHVKAIAALVKKGNYDGIDIDYEGKLAATAPYYSAFLKELKAALGGKTLSCTIEARTPPDSLYATIPKNLQYANDYKAINTYCDEVNLMTYDQQRADLKLNAARAGAPYYPVADLAWVKKVVALAEKDIDKSKITIGIATYGREVETTVSPNWFQAYKQVSSVSPEYAEDTADKYDVTPIRNAAGELSYSYVPSSSTARLFSSVPLKGPASSRDDVAAKALAYANKTGKTVTIRTVWWSDAKAVADKVALAQSLGVRGVSLFKLDGKEDPDLWDSF